MKTPFSLFLLLISIPILAVEEIDWYVFGGISTYQEDSDTLVGNGIGIRLGVGVQLTENFGLECIFDQTPALDEDVFINILEDEYGSFQSYDFEYWGNTYFSILGTFSAPINESVSWIAKAGMTSYEAEIEKGDAETFYYIYDFSFVENGTAAVASAGVVIETNEKSSFEISLTKVFGDWGALSFNGSWRYQF